MTRREKDKMYQFVKLCSSLTKQGFRFTVDKYRPFHLVMNRIDGRRLHHWETKTPFVDAVCVVEHSNKHKTVKFYQWADREPNRLTRTQTI